jgi:hypothetical protein
MHWDKGGGVQWDWTQEDVYYVSYGALRAYAFPEIYLENGGNADQWYRISLWGQQQHGQKITFSGTLTQFQACVDANNSCSGQKNSAARGWGQLSHWTSIDSRTVSSQPGSSDIRWNLP